MRRLLASGFWLLASGFWLLASGFWLLASGFWQFVSTYDSLWNASTASRGFSELPSDWLFSSPSKKRIREMNLRAPFTGVFALLLLAGHSSASDYYWTRNLCKGRVWVTSAIFGEGLSAESDPLPFSDGDSDDSGVVEDDYLNLSVSSDAAAGAGDASGIADSIGGLVTNVAGASNSTVDIQFIYSYLMSAATGETIETASSHGAFCNAKHTLCSDVFPSSTAVPCVCKLVVDWDILHLVHEEFIDWVVVGFPGTPTIYMDGTSLTISYWDDATEGYVEQYEGINGTVDAGGLYVDVPGVLPVGAEVWWLGSSGTYSTGSGGLSGTGYNYGSGSVMGGSIINIKVWLSADEELEEE